MKWLKTFFAITVLGISTQFAMCAGEVLRLDDYLEAGGKNANCFFTIEAPAGHLSDANMGMVTNLYGMDSRIGILSNVMVCLPEYKIVANVVCSNVFHLISTNMTQALGKGLDTLISISHTGPPAKLIQPLKQLCPGIVLDSGLTIGAEIRYEGEWDWEMTFSATNTSVRDVLTCFLPMDETWYSTLWIARRMEGGCEGMPVYGIRFGGKRR